MRKNLKTIQKCGRDSFARF